MPRARILITGVGSLIGQNLLNALETRRACVDVVGTNAAIDSTRVLRCDRTHLVPRNDQPGYATRLSEIIREESPDLVFPGRDPDVVVLSELAKSRGLGSGQTPFRA
ncbi:MAG: hypothetical protein EXS37_03985 [Opitutus sp.]|nr:hypothetical protein [Opitutus sp.]